MRATRAAYGAALVDLMSAGEDVVVLDSDLARSTSTDKVLAAFPDRHYNAGIAEANMVGMAAGLALSGATVFATTYAIFVGRAYDQIRQAVSYPRMPVTVVATHGGLSASHDGGSHQGIEDLALMTVLPHMVVLSPSDYNEAYAAVVAAARHDGPVYLRLSKFPTPELTVAGEPFTIGPARLLVDGEDVVLVATGVLVAEALEASRVLRGRGVGAAVISVATLKPLDPDLVRMVAGHRLVVTVEEHSRHGGLFAAVAGLLVGGPHPPVVSVSMPDVYGQTGEWRELLDLYGMSSGRIAATVEQALDDLRAVVSC